MVAKPKRPAKAKNTKENGEDAEAGTTERPTPSQLRWLASGLAQPGGKLPLFDSEGQKISDRTVRSCLEKGWAEPWFANPIKPDWLICKLTAAGRQVARKDA